MYRVREDIGVARFFLFGPGANPLGISFSNPNSGTNLWSLQSFFGSRSFFFGFGTLPVFGNYQAHQAGSDWASSGAPSGGAATGDFDGRPQGINHGGGVDSVDVAIFDDLIAEFNEDFTMRVRGGEDECTVIILDNDDAPGIFDRNYNPDFDDRTIPPQNSAPGANNTVFATAVQAGRFVLVGIGIITVAAGFYYYLRIVAAMYWQEPNDDTKITLNPLSKFTIGALTAAIFFFGIFPQPILNSLHGAPIPVAHAAR